MTMIPGNSIPSSRMVALLRDALRARLPVSVTLQADPPFSEDGVHILDIAAVDWSATVTVNAHGRLGLAAGPDDEAVFGELVDEHWGDWRGLVERVVTLHDEKGSTAPSVAGLLASLRDVVGVSQRVLARRLGVTQPAVSAQESRGNVGVDTLGRIARSLNCLLSISVDHPAGRLLVRDGEGLLRQDGMRASVVRSLEAASVCRPPSMIATPRPDRLRSLPRLTVQSASVPGNEEVLDVSRLHDPDVRSPLDAGPRSPHSPCRAPLELGAA
ncbi:MAG: XRE family transcriptional regulator [Deltaproteobacteria bacterium]|nr:MAG: XRE family transcriptional regulator [Deltaproteobacteria bacterium]